MTIEITKENFDLELAGNPEPALLLFWSERHEPGLPLLRRLESCEAARTLRICTLHTDRQRDAAMQFELQGIPTVFLLQNGQILSEWYAPQPESRLFTMVERFAAEARPII